jgi:hypothetical protein
MSTDAWETMAALVRDVLALSRPVEGSAHDPYPRTL